MSSVDRFNAQTLGINSPPSTSLDPHSLALTALQPLHASMSYMAAQGGDIAQEIAVLCPYIWAAIATGLMWGVYY